MPRCQGRSTFLAAVHESGFFCEGFQTLAVTNIPTRTAAGVWKPSRDETARKGTYWAVPARLLWGFGCGRATAEVSSEGRLSGEDVDAGRRRCVLAICGPVYRRRSVGLLRGEGSVRASDRPPP